ncbi:MAG: PH domain-containing protein [Streptosporangiaceae bacterium]
MTTWRPRRSRAIAYTMASIIMVMMVVLAIVVPPPFGVIDKVGLILFGGLVAGILCLIGRCRLTADARGLTVVNVVRTHRYEWAEIVRINLQPGDPWPTLDLANGESIGAMGIQGSEGERAKVAVREVRELLVQYGEAREP